MTFSVSCSSLIPSQPWQLLLLWPDSTFVDPADKVTVAIHVARTANKKYVTTKSELNWKLHMRQCLWTLLHPVYQQMGVITTFIYFFLFPFWPSWMQKINPICKTRHTFYNNVCGSRLPPFLLRLYLCHCCSLEDSQCLGPGPASTVKHVNQTQK